MGLIRGLSTGAPQARSVGAGFVTPGGSTATTSPEGAPMTWEQFQSYSPDGLFNMGLDPTDEQHIAWVKSQVKQQTGEDITDDQARAHLEGNGTLSLPISPQGLGKPGGANSGLVAGQNFKLPKGMNPEDYTYTPMYGGWVVKMTPKAGGQDYYLGMGVARPKGGDGVVAMAGYNRTSNQDANVQAWIEESGVGDQLTTASTTEQDAQGYSGSQWSTRKGKLNRLGRAGNYYDQDDDTGWQLTTYDPLAWRKANNMSGDDNAGNPIDFTAPRTSRGDKIGEMLTMGVIGFGIGAGFSAALGAGTATATTAGSGLAGSLSGTVGATAANAIAYGFAGSLTAGTMAAITGGDVGKAMALGAVGGAVGGYAAGLEGGANFVGPVEPGITTSQLVTAGGKVATGLISGQDPATAIVGGAANLAGNYVGQQVGDLTGSAGFGNFVGNNIVSPLIRGTVANQAQPSRPVAPATSTGNSGITQAPQTVAAPQIGSLRRPA